MRRAQRDAGLAGPGAVDAVLAHATATPAEDLAEARAINEVLGEHGPCRAHGLGGLAAAAAGPAAWGPARSGLRTGRQVPERRLDLPVGLGVEHRVQA